MGPPARLEALTDKYMASTVAGCDDDPPRESAVARMERLGDQELEWALHMWGET